MYDFSCLLLTTDDVLLIDTYIALSPACLCSANERVINKSVALSVVLQYRTVVNTGKEHCSRRGRWRVQAECIGHWAADIGNPMDFSHSRNKASQAQILSILSNVGWTDLFHDSADLTSRLCTRILNAYIYLFLHFLLIFRLVSWSICTRKHVLTSLYGALHAAPVASAVVADPFTKNLVRLLCQWHSGVKSCYRQIHVVLKTILPLLSPQ